MQNELDMYSRLFALDKFKEYEEFPKDIKKYKALRELSCMDFLGINYIADNDVYRIRVRNGKNSYRLVGYSKSLVEAIIAYDIAIYKSKNIQLEPYVKNGERVYKPSPKYHTKSNKIFIEKYKNIFNYIDIAKMLGMKRKDVHRIIYNKSGVSIKDINTPTVVVWDIRDKYESMVEDLVDRPTVSDTYVDSLLGITE